MFRPLIIAFTLLLHFARADDLAPKLHSNQSLLWGPYRSNLYFGIRPRIPESLLMGVMWTRVENGHLVQSDLRHTCEQNEGMAGYGWTEYDPRTGGSQMFHDVGNRLDVSTEFFKPADYEGSWGARIKGTPRPDAGDDFEGAFVFYVGTEEQASDEAPNLQCIKQDEGAAANIVDCSGHHPVIGDFKLSVRDGSMDDANSNERSRTILRSDSVPAEGIWQAKSIFIAHVNSGKEQTGNGSLYFVQKDFKGAFEFDVVFSSDGSNPMTYLTMGLQNQKLPYAKLFEAVYSPKPPFHTPAYTSFSKSLLSNLLGGIGYFHGSSKIDRSYALEYDETDLSFWEKTAEAQARDSPEMTVPKELFTLVPSRSSIPRGFLWDEGFHLLVVLEWDLDLAMEIVTSWFALMDRRGWIAREQILGDEASSKVPEEFQVQYPHHANPPTLFLVVEKFVEAVVGNETYSGHPSQYLSHPEIARQFLGRLYPLLKQNYDWFRRTQSGDLENYARPEHFANEAYRWRGRTLQHTLTSGLDDYPRAEPPHPGELHLDAITWVGSMAGVLKKIAAFLGENEDQVLFVKQEQAIKRNIESLHWSEEEQAYCDATVVESRHSSVCHKGYVSLFPFLVGLIGAEHEHLGAVLDLIKDENELWSSHGIRSLSQKDQYYETQENYWRSPIWININYLIVERLLKIAQTSGPHQTTARDMYTSLRRTLVDTVYDSWQKTGFAWEQYHPDTGAGQRTQHFTGWTALIVKVTAMPNFETGYVHGSSENAAWSLPSMRTVAPGAGLAIFVIVFRRMFARIWRWILR